MQQVLNEFIVALRQSDVGVSPAETLDALHTLKIIGLDDRPRLKTALGLVLAKSQDQKYLYEQLFDRYFQVPGAPGAEVDEPVGADATAAQNPEDPMPLIADGDAAAAVVSALGRQLLDGDAAELSLAVATAAREAGVNQIQVFTQKSRYSYDVLQRLGMDALNREINTLNQNPADLGQQLLLTRLQHRRQQLVDQVKDYVEQQYLLFAGQQGRRLQDESLQKVRLTNIDLHHYQHMTRLVRKAAKQLAAQHARRRKVAKRGLLDVRRTIAANAAFDGIQFRTRWKSVRIDRPKVVAICDVSGSVSRVARFLLLFLYSLQDVMPRVRSFVFTAALTEVTDCFAELELEAAVSDLLNNWGNMSTDYGRALRELDAHLLSDIDNKTTVIMLGDARNNDADGNAGVWERVYRRSRRVIWLNPESRVSWNTGDSIMRDYAPFCSQVEPCNSLRDLTRIFSRLLRHS
ncbi:VWA domain-containing protein [Exilibacterium tricleocarpae]|uniref:VWA domain-containing protein n=1 Tax=Exilibacterium tricleocarpae TaxID=2591008 RepID=A0A545U5N6_9GAMM|nr:VWA domain-containing protein [Exilibacterium tricleocarpae]TQV84781.1 VWA domain-containing protein [Exilibacterium tricleocarpae]